MSRSKKLTATEAKLKKKEYDRKRREKLKNCPKSLEKLREKERLKYLKKKEKGQVKSVSVMSSREKRQKRKQWRLNSSKYRERNPNVRRNLARLMDETPPASPVSLVESGLPVNPVKNDTIASRRRRQLRNRRAILYGRIAKLEQNLNKEARKSEKYRKKYTRLNDKILNDDFHLGYYKISHTSDKDKSKDTPVVSTRRKRRDVKLENDVKIPKTIPSEKGIHEYKVGDHVLITWNNEIYPGKICSLSDDGALVRCMKKGSKCWKWPTVKDEELYAWSDILRAIQPPKLLSRGSYFVKEIDEKQ